MSKVSHFLLYFSTDKISVKVEVGRIYAKIGERSNLNKRWIFMTIDWKEEAAKRKDDMLADLKTMLRIESVRDEAKELLKLHLDQVLREALDKFLEIRST